MPLSRFTGRLANRANLATTAFRAGAVAMRGAARRDAAMVARRVVVPVAAVRRAAIRGSAKEVNFLDTDIAASLAASGTATIKLLNGMQTGTTASTRVGRKIKITSIQVRANCKVGIPAAGGTVDSYMGRVAFAIVYDKQSNGVAPAWLDVFDNSSTTTTSNPFAMRNMSNAERFVVLYYKYGDLAVNQATTTNGAGQATEVTQLDLDCYRKVNLETQFNAGNAGTIADIATGSLYTMYLGVDTETAGTLFSCTGFARIRYTD